MDNKTKRYVIIGVLGFLVVAVLAGVLVGLLMVSNNLPDLSSKSKMVSPQTVDTPLAPSPPSAPKDVTLRTEDGVAIAATYYLAKGDGVILLHMLGSDRSVWSSFAKQLQDAGFAVIALDFRGHGESDLDWRDFASPSGITYENDFLGMVLDVKAAKKYLNGEGTFAKVIIGASIGANIATLYAETDSRVEDLVLLSSSMNYRGVALPAGPLFTGNVLMVAGSEDKVASEATTTYGRRIRGEHKTILYPGSDHGTELLQRQPELADRIISWIDR